ncbi:MAG: thioredoxin domain-containing protein [Pelagibacteraceae bacterium]|nr:thioredoxin domain-containing protein [Pelagibacteraceae bacterium]MBT5213046.1 thioredoxin domain-containing protein [Pelagibacteraceae bacterium]MBT6353778.1 thioredoxin domain-containing protein [Pelagibacteraceae bacterium]
MFIFLLIPTHAFSNDMTLQELFFDDSKPYHLKILEALPESAIIQYGPKDAENTIIEFMDYFCGYCKKIHPELISLTEKRDDTRVIFLQHPILSESSKVIAAMVVAANLQNKGWEMHHGLFSIQGSLTQKKLDEIIIKSEINKTKLMIDIGKDEINNIVKLSSFLAMGSGARGTPALFINEEFVGGYLPLDKLERILK